MRFVKRVVLATAMVAGLSAIATAQPRGGGFGGGFQFDAYSLIVNGFTNEVSPALAEELKLSDEQKDKLKEAVKPIGEKRREMFQGINFREMTDEQRKELREKGEKLAVENKKAIEGALKPEQAKRLSQINYQVMGISAYTNKDVETALKLTEDQKERIKGIVDEYNKDATELRRNGPRFQPGQPPSEEDQKKRAEIQKKVDALTKEIAEKIAEKLTDEQKKALKDMKGEKFDTTKLFQAPRRPKD
jgi:Spy/CpxP family protein refolding chaperone